MEVLLFHNDFTQINNNLQTYLHHLQHYKDMKDIKTLIDETLINWLILILAPDRSKHDWFIS